MIGGVAVSKRKVWAVNVLCLAGCGGEIGDEEDTWEEGAALDRVFAAHDDTTGKEL